MHSFVEKWLTFKLSYGIYSAVFLNRADTFGALGTKEERNEILKLVLGFIAALKVAATSGHHIGLRYSRLLQSLWFPVIDQATPESQQQNVSQINPRNTLASEQSSAEAVQGFAVPDILGTSYDVSVETSMPTWAEAAGFDPFCGSFSYFEADIFGTLSQRDIDFGISLEN
jgi:hypothetical protein